MSRPGLAYNAPAASHQEPVYTYVVVMQRAGETYRSQPLTGSEIDGHIGWKHRGGWQYVTTEQVA